MNEYFRKLDWPCFESIQERLVPLILQFYNTRFRHDAEMFNSFTEEELEQINHSVPEFVPLIEQNLRSEVKWIRMIYLDENFPKDYAHYDVRKEDCEEGLEDYFFRLNWPILNPDSFETVFFDPNGSKPVWNEQYRAHIYEKNKMIRLHSFIADKPVLMNVRRIHGIYQIKSPTPRILLSVRLVESSSSFLRDLAIGKETIS